MYTQPSAEISLFTAKKAIIHESGIWGAYHFTIGNLTIERKTSGFLGGGTHKYVWYECSLNGKVFRKVLSYNELLISYSKLLMQKVK